MKNSQLYCFYNNIGVDLKEEVPIYVGKIKTIFNNFGLELVRRNEDDQDDHVYDVFKKGYEISVYSEEFLFFMADWDTFSSRLRKKGLMRFGKLYKMEEV